MGIPVVIKASGGLPVTVAANGYGTPMTSATNGYGAPVTVVASGGAPVVGISGGGGGGGYTGPGDILSGAIAWGGLQAYTAAYASALGAALDLYLANEVTPYPSNPIHLQADGKLNLTEAAAAIAGGYTFCGRLYDQTGNGRHFTPRVYMPTFSITTGPNGTQPALTMDPVGRALQTVSTVSVSQPWSIFALVKPRSGAAGTLQIFGVDTDAALYASFDITSAGYRFAAAASPIVRAGSAGSFACVTGLANGASSTIWVNAASTSGNAGSGAIAGAKLGVGEHQLLGQFDGEICEIGIWGANITSSQSALNTNAHSAGRWNF